MSLPYHKPPPYERANWQRLNEGQRRYAMEQYNLALVRRGAKFNSPVQAPATPHVQEQNDPIADLDTLDALLDALDTSAGGADDTESEPNETPSTSRGTTGTSSTSRPHSVSEEQDLLSGMSTGTQMDTGDADSSASPSKNRKLNDGSAVAGVAGTSTSGSQLPGTSGNTDGMTGAGNVSDGSQGVRTIPRGINTPTYSWTFKKKWKFLSFGVADTILNDILTTGQAPTTRLALTTSLVNLPWEYSFFYMSPAEFTRLQSFNGVFAKRCRVRVYQYNPRVAFQTADTTSTQATLNQNKFTRTAIGLRSNSNLYGSDRDYVFDTTEPMKPTGFQTTGSYTGQTNRQDLALYMYGAANSSATVANYVPAVCTGQELGLQRYYTVYTEKTPVAAGNDYGFPQYNSFCNEYNAMDMIGKAVVQESHNFEYAPLHQRANNYQIPALTVGDNPATLPANLPANLALLDGTRIEMPRQKIFPTVGAGQATDGIDENCPVVDVQAGGTSAGFGNVSNFAGNTMYTKFPMEQSGVYIEKNRKGSDYNAQQSIHIGVRAVPKLGTAVNLIEANSWLSLIHI